MSDHALRFEDVRFRYPDTSRDALTEVTLDIDEGTFALAVGPTGAGKSTLLRASNGLVPHFTGGTFRGRVTVDGRDTLEFPPRKLADAVAFVPQDPGASFVLDRVEDELAYGMENLGVDPAHMRRRVEETLDLLDIEPLRARSVRTLSGGERQRVAIAAALAAGPRILVLDEPTSQLDPQGAEHAVAALQRLVHDQGITVLLAEHRLERVAGFVDLALGFSDGHVEVGPPAEVIRRLAMGPPVARLGRLAGWDPVPLTVREARRMGAALIGDAGPPRVQVATPGPALVELRGVEVRHGDVPALRDIALTIGRGEIVAVMGRNGAGKTTLLRAIAGVHEPFRGRVTVDGHIPQPGVDTGMCPQEPESILFAETVADEVRTTLKARGLGTGPEPVLEALGIEDLAGRHPRDLSAGQRLLVATAAVAAGLAPAILLDEPTRGLDPDAKDRLVRYLRRHAADGGVAMLATHDVELAAAVATRVVMLAGGEVIADGDPGVVLGDSTVFAPQMTRAFGPGWLTPEQVAEALA
jgi:energy-coupling factor transporter ATP-binding protein EcfA2